MRYMAVQLCSIFLILSTLIMSGKLKTISTRSTRIYKRVVYIILACLIFDILSIILIINLDEQYIQLVSICCKLYLISIILVGTSIFAYLLADQPKSRKTVFVFKGIISLYTLSIIIYIISQPIYVRFDNELKLLYSEGPSVDFTFTNMAILLIISLILSYFLYAVSRISKGKAEVVQIWTYLMIIGGIIQYLNREFLIIGFSMALGAIIVFEKRESPNKHTDADTELYNATAFRAHIRESFALNRRIYCLRLAVNTGRKDLTLDESAQIIQIFTKVLKKCPGNIFKTSSYSFAVVSENKISISMAAESITAFVKQANRELVLPGIKCLIYTIKDMNLFENADQYINMYYKLKSYKLETDEYIVNVNVDSKVLSSITSAERTRKEITSALEENRVEVFYQPIYNIKTNTFNSAEALLRLRKPDGSIIPPMEIIPVAEESGLIIPLGERVFSLVCEFLGDENRPKNLNYIEVNLSAVQCKHEALYGTFKGIMKKSGIGPQQINLEITETARLSTNQKTISVFNCFRNDGVSFSLDDFGTGNSNLDYVSNMPMISIIKFDQAMTNGFFTNDRIKAIFPHIIKMVKDMNLEIVCEGIETEDRLNTMKDFGIDYIQGYYFSKPLPKDEFIEFMNKYKNGYFEEKDNN